jgi:hypothetical protein
VASSTRRSPKLLASNKGSAPVDFLAFGLPGMLAIVLASQVILGAYFGVVALDAASEAATIAATADASYSAGANRAQAVLAGLPVPVGAVVQGHRVASDSAWSWKFTVRVTSPLLWFSAVQIKESAEALDEEIQR